MLNRFRRNQPGVATQGRRLFLRSAVGALAAAPALAGIKDAERDRMEQCFRVRSTAAAYKLSQPELSHPTNGDEELFPNGAASYSKGLPHGSDGEPLAGSYAKLTSALREGTFAAIENTPLGGGLKLLNPLACKAMDLEGLDACQLTLPPPPTFSSARQAWEMAELYWQALTRDVPFARWNHDATIAAAANDLANANQPLSIASLFRMPFKGVADGPYVSQFLLLPVPYGDLPIEQRYLSPVPNQSFGVTPADWAALQNGHPAQTRTQIESERRFLATPRGLAEFVHRDYTFQAALYAGLILCSLGKDALADNNPYKWAKSQSGFATFGPPHIIDSMARAANAATKAAWFQKWSVHRRIRPEEYAGRVHATLTGARKYPVHANLLKSSVLNVSEFAHGSYLLPQAYAEGCPSHPSYPAGHAAIAGACTTMLKAFFREDYVLPNAVQPDLTGSATVPYTGALTAGGELNKLAANVAMARDIAGVHWRSDSEDGMRLGEAVAVGLLRDALATFPEPFEGFSFTGFDGQNIVISL